MEMDNSNLRTIQIDELGILQEAISKLKIMLQFWLRLQAYRILIAPSHLLWVQTLLVYLNNQIRHTLTLLQEIIYTIQIHLKIIVPIDTTTRAILDRWGKGVRGFTLNLS